MVPLLLACSILCTDIYKYLDDKIEKEFIEINWAIDANDVDKIATCRGKILAYTAVRQFISHQDNSSQIKK
jgi:hypothetical protein